MLEITGAPGTIRTSDPQIRSLVLYPAELRAHLAKASRAAGPAVPRNRDCNFCRSQKRAIANGSGADWQAPQKLGHAADSGRFAAVSSTGEHTYARIPLRAVADGQVR